MTILHITDFHIDSPISANENLRKGFYKEFIDSLFLTIREHGHQEVDLLVNSGDFVNQGKVKNFSHASEILDYIVGIASLNKEDVALCIGNHDFKMKDPGSLQDKINPFENFSKDYNAGDLLGEAERAKLYKSRRKDMQILILDNASTAEDQNRPITLAPGDMDIIIALVREHAMHSKDLVVVSHYPVIGFPMAKYTTEVDDWSRDHIWKDGFNLQHRLGQLRPNGETIFLCGDGHIPDAFRSENKVFIMTGLFGGDYTRRSANGGAKSFYIETQARIIEFGENRPVKISTFNYKPIAYDFDPHAGRWYFEESELREILYKPKEHREKTTVKTNILSDTLQKAILDRVRNEKLYKIGRYLTSSDVNSFSWVSINRIFEDQQIFNSLIDKGVEKLSQILGNNDKALILGVDFHGAMIGTHVAVRLGCHLCCLSTRSLITSTEDLHPSVINQLANGDFKDVVIVTDVVSSGNSVLKIVQEIETAVAAQGGEALDCKYHSISIIADSRIERTAFDATITSVHTACRELRMPIFKSDDLPDKETLPTRIDLTSPE